MCSPKAVYNHIDVLFQLFESYPSLILRFLWKVHVIYIHLHNWICVYVYKYNCFIKIVCVRFAYIHLHSKFISRVARISVNHEHIYSTSTTDGMGKSQEASGSMASADQSSAMTSILGAFSHLEEHPTNRNWLISGSTTYNPSLHNISRLIGGVIRQVNELNGMILQRSN